MVFKELFRIIRVCRLISLGYQLSAEGSARQRTRSWMSWVVGKASLIKSDDRVQPFSHKISSLLSGLGHFTSRTMPLFYFKVVISFFTNSCFLFLHGLTLSSRSSTIE